MRHSANRLRHFLDREIGLQVRWWENPIIEWSRKLMKDASAIIGDEAAILNRLIRPKEKLPQAAARALLRFSFDETDRARMHELALKNQADELSAKEEVELQSYLKVGLFLDLLHAKANLSLNGH